MKRSLTKMILLAATLAMGGCVDDYGGGYGGVYSAGAYPYGGYYDGYTGGYYRGDTYYRNAYPRDRSYRARPHRQPRSEWNGGTVRGHNPGRGHWNDRNNNWNRNPAGSGDNRHWNGRR